MLRTFKESSNALALILPSKRARKILIFNDGMDGGLVTKIYQEELEFNI